MWVNLPYTYTLILLSYLLYSCIYTYIFLSYIFESKLFTPKFKKTFGLNYLTDNNLHIIYQKSLKIYIKKFDKLDIIVLDLWKLLKTNKNF